MLTGEELWRVFVDCYDIEVPEEAIQNELDYLTLQLKHNMQYDRLSGGDLHLFPEQEIAAQQEDLRRAALFEAKEPRVLKALIEELELDASTEELEEEAAAMAQRQGSTVDAIKQFFGEDLSLLKRDVVEQKARDWVVSRLVS